MFRKSGPGREAGRSMCRPERGETSSGRDRLGLEFLPVASTGCVIQIGAGVHLAEKMGGSAPPPAWPSVADLGGRVLRRLSWAAGEARFPWSPSPSEIEAAPQGLDDIQDPLDLWSEAFPPVRPRASFPGGTPVPLREPTRTPPAAHYLQVLPERAHSTAVSPTPPPGGSTLGRRYQELEVIATGLASGSESVRVAPSIRERREGPDGTPASIGWPTGPVSTRGRFLGVQFAIPEWLERPAFAPAGGSSNQGRPARIGPDATPLSADSPTAGVPVRRPVEPGIHGRDTWGHHSSLWNGEAVPWS